MLAKGTVGGEYLYRVMLLYHIQINSKNDLNIFVLLRILIIVLNCRDAESVNIVLYIVYKCIVES